MGAATTKFLYDGADAIVEYDGANALQRRFVFDPTTGQPVLWYEGTGTAATNRRYLSQDERGSVISVSGSTGASLGLNTYDEYGKPGAANLGRCQYTGQKWIGEAGLYDYKARDYVPQLGIFAQSDPIGYGGGINLYAYVEGDPLNRVDPLGLVFQAEFANGVICTFDNVDDSGHPINFKCSGGDQSGGSSYYLGVVNDYIAYVGLNNIPVLVTARRSDETAVTSYWQAERNKGNPIADLGLQFGWTDRSGLLASAAKQNLMGAILGTPVKGRHPTLAQALNTYGEIRTALMYADQAARASDISGIRGLLSPGQLYDYHIAVFGRFGLPPTAFGGSAVFGTRNEAYSTNAAFGWCTGCDR